MDYKKFDKYIGEQLLNARLDKRMTQEDLTKIINYELLINQNIRKKPISRQSYTNYELGKRSIPDDVFRCACASLSLNASVVFKKASEKYIATTILPFQTKK